MTRSIPAKSSPGRLAALDVRTVMFVTACAAVSSYAIRDLPAHIVLTLALFALTAVLGRARTGVKLLVVYVVAVAWMMVELRTGITMPPPLALAMVYKAIPLLMPAILLFSIPSARLALGIRQLGVPARIQLTLTVVLRFIPTVAAEAADVRDAMRTRGFLRSPATVLRHPLNTMEYVIVPLVFRELKVADELAAAATVRGAESPYPRHGYYANRLRPVDAVLAVLVLVLCVGLALVPAGTGV